MGENRQEGRSQERPAGMPLCRFAHMTQNSVQSSLPTVVRARSRGRLIIPLHTPISARQELATTGDCGGYQHLHEAEDELDTGNPKQDMVADARSQRPNVQMEVDISVFVAGTACAWCTILPMFQWL